MATTRYQGAAAGAPIPESLLISRDQPVAGYQEKVANYRSTVPVIRVTVAPATQTRPLSSSQMWTRPLRPIAVPWLAVCHERPGRLAEGSVASAGLASARITLRPAAAG